MNFYILTYNCHAYAWASCISVTDGSDNLKKTDSPIAVEKKAYYITEVKSLSICIS